MSDIFGEQLPLSAKALGSIEPAAYLGETFNEQLTALIDQIALFALYVRSRSPHTIVTVHGFDYFPVRPEDLSKPPYSKVNVVDLDLAQEISNESVNRFNKMLSTLVLEHENLSYLNLRGTLKPDNWHDRLNPSDSGFLLISKKFRKHLGE